MTTSQPARPPGLYRPLVHLNVAMCDLNASAAEIRDLLELGCLGGFNIAVKPLPAGDGGRVAGKFRTELRIVARSLEQFRALKARQPFEKSWSTMLRLLVRHKKPQLTGLEIQRILNCDRGHVKHLVRAGHLVALKESQWGPGGSWSISRASFEAFLQSRRC